MWKLLYLLSSITLQVLCGKLVGNHICITEESYSVNVTEHYVRNATVRNYKWCLNVPPRCSFYTTKQINDMRIVEKPQTRTVEKCCEGFYVKDNKCVSYCHNCVNGICKNDTCECSPGYRGKNCDNGCQSGFWGQNCTEKCDCEYQSCNPVNGNCLLNHYNKNEIKSKLIDDLKDKMTSDIIKNPTTDMETIKMINNIDYNKHTTENYEFFKTDQEIAQFDNNFINSITKNEITTRRVEFVSKYDSVKNTPLPEAATTIVPTSSPDQIIINNKHDVLFSNITKKSAVSPTILQKKLQDEANDDILNKNREVLIPVEIRYDQTMGPLSQKDTKISTSSTVSEEKNFLVVADNNDNDSHISSKDKNLINSVSVSVATTIAFIILAVVLLTIDHGRRTKKKENEKIGTKKNVGVSTVSIYATSIFHTPLPDPPTFENPSYLTPMEYQNGTSDSRAFETHVVCNMNMQNQQKTDYKDMVYDHPPSTGSYRAASVIEPLDIDQKPPITQTEPVYDEIPCRGPEITPYYNQPLSLYINTCGRTSS